GAVTSWLGWRAVLAIPVVALPLLPTALAGRRAFTPIGGGEPDGSAGRFDITGAAVLSVLAGAVITLLQAHSVGLPAPVTLVVAAAGALAVVGLWWRVRSTPDGFVPRRVITARGFLPAGLVGATIFAGYYGVLFLAPSLIEQATGGGALEAGALLVPAAACSVPAGRLAGTLTGRFTGWQVSAGLAALTVAGVLVVAAFTGPVPVVVGTALTVCGFAGAQAVLVGLAPELVATRDRDTAQGLFTFMIFLGGGIGPAAVAGLSGIVSVPVALALLAALPLAGLVIGLTRRPGA
ncbi:MFS transporter, partial [Amycolatopsis sp. NPDC049252]|uniref:MFS transporter n=1 Tax=Amycolatopsis sp. NPDC049252 TaxID=3363933 RepID=UPI00371D6368